MTLFLFFFNDTATTEIYTLSLHDALPIWARDGDLAGDRSRQGRLPRRRVRRVRVRGAPRRRRGGAGRRGGRRQIGRAHGELQSRQYLVCRLLPVKKNITSHNSYTVYFFKL